MSLISLTHTAYVHACVHVRDVRARCNRTRWFLWLHSHSLQPRTCTHVPLRDFCCNFKQYRAVSRSTAATCVHGRPCTPAYDRARTCTCAVWLCEWGKWPLSCTSYIFDQCIWITVWKWKTPLAAVYVVWNKVDILVCNASQTIIIIIIRHAPCQCVAPLATNSLHSDLSKASSIASSKVRLCRDRSLFKVAIQEV